MPGSSLKRLQKFSNTTARREHKAEQGRQENRPEMRHNRIVPLAPSGSVEAYGKGRQGKKGVARLTEAVALMDTTEGRHGAADVYRVKGRLPMQTTAQGRRSKGEEEAETYYRQAIEIAQRQQAKSWELRAAMSLARLWHRQGRKAEAHQLLAEIYKWFTEGFDTKDLQEAKALLEELT